MQVLTLFKALGILYLGILLSGCLGSSTSSSTSSKPQSQQSSVTTPKNPLTLSDVGIVPQIGGSSGSHMLYVYNHSNKDIKDIVYQVKGVTNNLSFSLNEASIKSCNVVRAGSSCPLVFSELINSDKLNTGSAIVEAMYKIDNETRVFSQLIRIQRIEPSEEADLMFSSGLNVNSYGNNTGYGIMYLYSANNKGKFYDVEDIKLSKSGLEIVQGRARNSRLTSGFVYTLEIKSPVASTNVSSAISTVLVGGRSINSTINVDEVNSKAAITPGLAKLIDISKTKSGSLSIRNNGSNHGILNDIVYPTGLSKASGTNACEKGSKLGSGQSCIIYFDITGAGISGSGDIKLLYAGGDSKETSQRINWFDSRDHGLPLLQITPSVNDISVAATQTTKPISITLTNIGNKALNLRALTFGTSAHIRGGNMGQNDSCTNKELKPNASCTYYAIFTANSSHGDGQIELKVFGTYLDADKNQQPYERMIMVGYKVSPYAAAIVLQAPNQIQVIGNNAESAIQIIKVSNNGEAPAIINWSLLENRESSLRLIIPEDNGCKEILGPGMQCNLMLFLGPKFLPGEENITGNVKFKVIYSGGTIKDQEAINNINYLIEGIGNISANFRMAEVKAENDRENGNGSEAKPYVFYGSSINKKSVIFTYSYRGTKKIKFDSIIHHKNTDTRIWEIDENASTCHKTILSNGNTCIIKYNNVLASRLNEGLMILEGTERDLELYAPSLTYGGSLNHRIDPNIPHLGEMLHVKTRQAIVRASARTISTFKINVSVHAESGGLSDYGITAYDNIRFATSRVVVSHNFDYGNCPPQGDTSHIVHCDVAKAIEYGSRGYDQQFKSHQTDIEVVYAIKLSGDRFVAGNYKGLINLRLKSLAVNPEAFIGSTPARKVIRCPIIKEDVPKIDFDKCRDFFNAEVTSLRAMPDKKHILIATRNQGELFLCKTNVDVDCKKVYVNTVNAPTAMSSVTTITESSGKDRYHVFVSELAGTNFPSSVVRFIFMKGVFGYELIKTDRYLLSRLPENKPIYDVSYVDQENNEIRVVGRAEPGARRQLFACNKNTMPLSCEVRASNWINPGDTISELRSPFGLYQFDEGIKTYAIDFDKGELAYFTKGVSWLRPFGEGAIINPQYFIKLPNATTASDVKPDGFNTGIFIVSQGVPPQKSSICYFKLNQRLINPACTDVTRYTPSTIEILAE